MAKIQNLVNTSFDIKWTSFTTNILASVTNPTGLTGTATSYYMQIGKVLFIKYQYRQTAAAATPGSGFYIFNLPPGFTINTTVAPLYVSLTNFCSVGNSTINLNGTSQLSAFGVCVPYNTTSQYTMAVTYVNSTTPLIISGFSVLSGAGPLSLSNTSLVYTASCVIPIV
jgi:hypothetical protein